MQMDSLGTGLVVEDDVEEGAVYAQLAVVINETQFAELIHKMTDARAGGADHLGQCFLIDLRNGRLRLPLFPEIRYQEQRSRKPLLAGVE